LNPESQLCLNVFAAWLSGSAIAGSELENRRFLANDSATAFAPFIRAIAQRSCWRRFSMVRSACSNSATVTAGCDVLVRSGDSSVRSSPNSK
jgi:hypothetical protein